MDAILEWTHQYIAKTAETYTNADVSHHGPFYSVCQAIFYIFVFRNKELMEMPEGKWNSWNMQLFAMETLVMN